MMAAEAANELGDLANAKNYLQPVMDRAYGAAAATKMAVATDKATMFNLIVNERKFEFAGEALRKVDLMRWGMLKEKMEEAKAKLEYFFNRQDYTATDGTVYEYSKYPEKVYYNVGMDYTITDTGVNDYNIYGLNYGDDDATGKGLGYETSTYVFCKSDATNSAKAQKYIDNFYLGDPDKKMFWPIWQVFINSSNGMLNNNGY
jgi:hypothetical protein